MPGLPLNCKHLMRTVALLGAFALILPVLLNISSSTADIYRWRDAQGHWHFSDSPPSGVDVEQLTATPGPQNPSAASPQSSASDSPLDDQPRPQTTENHAGVFWRVAKEGRKPSYLLGTIHSTDPRVTRLKPSVSTALDGADRFVMEMIIDNSVLLQFGANLMLTDGSDLENLLGQALFSRVVSAMTDYGMPEMVLHQLKPWAVMAMLSMPKPSGGAILDMVLYQRVRELGKPTSGLESAQEQLAVFEGMPLNDQIELLKMTIDQLPSLPAKFEQLLQAYLADDLGRIAALANQNQAQQNSQSLDRFMKRLNDERNQRMLQRTLPYLEQGNTFIAVGALHLAGPAGLVQMLRRQGYRLESVR